MIQWTNSVHVRKAVLSFSSSIVHPCPIQKDLRHLLVQVRKPILINLFLALKQSVKFVFRQFLAKKEFLQMLIFPILSTWENLIFSSFSEYLRNLFLQSTCSGLSLNILCSASLRWSCCSQLVHSFKEIFLFRLISGSTIAYKLTNDCSISSFSILRGWLCKYLHNKNQRAYSLW